MLTMKSFLVRTVIAGLVGGLALLMFLLSFFFWEFFTPFNQLGEPLWLIALELLFWALIAVAEALALVSAYEWNQISAA